MRIKFWIFEFETKDEDGGLLAIAIIGVMVVILVAIIVGG